MMVVKYIDYRTKKELVTVNTSYVPIKGFVVSLDTLPPNPIKYIVYDVQHLVYIPPETSKDEQPVDEFKVYLMSISKIQSSIKKVIGLK